MVLRLKNRKKHGRNKKKKEPEEKMEKDDGEKFRYLQDVKANSTDIKNRGQGVCVFVRAYVHVCLCVF